jgi:hypothetical protein
MSFERLNEFGRDLSRDTLGRLSPLERAANKANQRILGDSVDPNEATRRAEEEEARKEALRKRISDLFTGPDAIKRFGLEEHDLSGALRGFQASDLERKYGDAERKLRFGAANTGNIGSATYADSLARVNEDNRRGGAQIEESVRRAITGLRSSREDAKIRALGLVNAGTGEQAVQSATAGLKGAADAASSANREQLFTDLFQDLAYTKVAGDTSNRNAAALAYLNRARGGSYFPTQSSPAGRIINTG